MADANYVSFVERLQKVEKRHRKLSRGYVRLKEVDGLLIPVPDRRVRRPFPAVGVMLTIAALLAFKGFLLAYHGPITYGERVDLLASGNIVEQAGAWIMRADPITQWIAQQFMSIPGLF